MMENERNMELIASYLAGELTEEEKQEWESKIQTGEISQEEVDAFSGMFLMMDRFPKEEPGPAMSDAFYASLETEKQKIQKPAFGKSFWERINDIIQSKISVSQLTFAMVLLVFGIAIGFWVSPADQYQEQLTALSSEVQKTREMMMLTLLEQPSATERLKAVNISYEINSATEQVTHALLNTLNKDNNVNVRLAALDALMKYAGDPAVREGLINAIANQDSPLVQIALAEAMEKLQEKNSVEQLEELLKKDDLNDAVKKQVQETIQTLI